MPEQSAIQQVLQNATAVQTLGQSGTPSGTNNGNPNTVYNTATTPTPPAVNSPIGVMTPPQGANSPIAPDAYIGAVLQGIANWNPPMPGSYAGGAGQLNGMLGTILGNIRNPQPHSPMQLPTVPGTGGTPGGGNLPATGGGPNAGGSAWAGPGEDWCVVGDSYLEGSVRAYKAVVGLVATTHTPEEGFKLTPIEAVSPPVLQLCVEIETDRGAKLSCSKSTPFTIVGAGADSDTVLAPDMLGRNVYVKRRKKITVEKVAGVRDIGEREVVPISFGGRSFPAGDDPDALVFSHNMIKLPGSLYRQHSPYVSELADAPEGDGGGGGRYNQAVVWGDTLPTSMAPVEIYNPEYTWGDTLTNAPFPATAPTTGTSPALGQSGFTGGAPAPEVSTPVWQQALNALVNPTGALIEVGGDAIDWLKSWWNTRNGN